RGIFRMQLCPPRAAESPRACVTRLDRLELDPDGFFDRIAGAYRELALAHPDRIRTIDASQPPEAVLAAARAAVEARLLSSPPAGPA
ncbi:MAG: hypothetical protein ACR2MK_01600, partial [Solirubrobacteraceae bacterium]